MLFSEFMTELGASFGAFFQGIGRGFTIFVLAMTAVIGALIVFYFILWFIRVVQNK